MEKVKLIKKLKMKVEEADSLTRNPVKMLFKPSEDLLKFSGDNDVKLQTWIDQVEDVQDEFDWSDDETLFFAEKLLTGWAKIIIDFERPAETWRKMKKILKEEFPSEDDCEDDFVKPAKPKAKKKTVKAEKKTTEKRKVEKDDLKSLKNEKVESPSEEPKDLKSGRSEVNLKVVPELKFAKEVNEADRFVTIEELKSSEGEIDAAKVVIVTNEDAENEKCRVKMNEVESMSPEVTKIEDQLKEVKNEVTNYDVKRLSVNSEPQKRKNSVDQKSEITFQECEENSTDREPRVLRVKSAFSKEDELKTSTNSIGVILRKIKIFQTKIKSRIALKKLFKAKRWETVLYENVKTIKSVKLIIKKKKKRASWKFEGVDGHPDDAHQFKVKNKKINKRKLSTIMAKFKGIRGWPNGDTDRDEKS